MLERWEESEIREGVREGNRDWRWRKRGTGTNTWVGEGSEVEAECVCERERELLKRLFALASLSIAQFLQEAAAPSLQDLHWHQ